MNRNRGALSLALAAAVVTLAVHQLGAEGQDHDMLPTGRNIGTRQLSPARDVNTAATPGGPGGSRGQNNGPNGISYHGGPMMSNQIRLYYIWYGNWSGNTATSILQDLATNIGGSPYFHINSSYTDSTGAAVSNNVVFGGATAVTNYPYGTSITDSQVRSLVGTAISASALPFDENGVYFVLTSADVNETSGFCSKYCGWHTYGMLSLNGTAKAIKYSFVGDPDRCIGSCAPQTKSPNGNAGADGMASIIAHELDEAANDPLLNGWYDSRGNESADKCAWTYGKTYAAAGGGVANMKLGVRDFLIQQNWLNANGGLCALSY